MLTPPPLEPLNDTPPGHDAAGRAQEDQEFYEKQFAKYIEAGVSGDDYEELLEKVRPSYLSYRHGLGACMAWHGCDDQSHALDSVAMRLCVHALLDDPPPPFSSLGLLIDRHRMLTCPCPSLPHPPHTNTTTRSSHQVHEAIREDPTPAAKKPWNGDREADAKPKKLSYVRVYMR